MGGDYFWSAALFARIVEVVAFWITVLPRRIGIFLSVKHESELLPALGLKTQIDRESYGRAGLIEVF